MHHRWEWASSGRWWRTKKPGLLQSMGSQRVRHDWATEQQWPTTIKNDISCRLFVGDLYRSPGYFVSWTLLCILDIITSLYWSVIDCVEVLQGCRTFGEADVLSAMAILIEGYRWSSFAIVSADGRIRLSVLEGNLVSTSVSPPKVLTGKCKVHNQNQK